MALPVTLSGTDLDGDMLSFRIVSQPAHGKVGLIGAQATYRAEAGFTGPDAFTFAAWDGKANSNLGTVTLSVGAPSCVGSAEEFGFGSLGSSGYMPRLSLSGCASPGASGALLVESALGGAPAVLYGGVGPAQREYAPGGVLRVQAIVFRVFGLTLGGSGPGQGSLAFPFTIPPTFPPSDLVFQVFVHDPLAQRLWAGTNGLEVHVR